MCVSCIRHHDRMLALGVCPCFARMRGAKTAIDQGIQGATWEAGQGGKMTLTDFCSV